MGYNPLRRDWKEQYPDQPIEKGDYVYIDQFGDLSKSKRAEYYADLHQHERAGIGDTQRKINRFLARLTDKEQQDLCTQLLNKHWPK